eukprot:3044103-Prymnesium_polylepis.1
MQADGQVEGDRLGSGRVVHHALGHVEHIPWRHGELVADKGGRVLHAIRRAALDVVPGELLEQAALRVAQLRVRRDLLARYARAPRLGAHELPHEHVVRVGVRLEHLGTGGRAVQVNGRRDAREVEERILERHQRPVRRGYVLEAEHERRAIGQLGLEERRRRLGLELGELLDIPQLWVE